MTTRSGTHAVFLTAGLATMLWLIAAASCLAPSLPVAPNVECYGGKCSCATGFGDCDGTLDNGCETSTASDPNNCGRCGIVCGRGACVDGSCPAGKWPPPPKESAPFGEAGAEVVLAMDRLLLGDTDHDFNESADAWREYGYDLDGLTTTDSPPPLADLCQLRSGAWDSVHVDGPDGIDNNLHLVTTLMVSIVQGYPSVMVKTSIDEGELGYLLRIRGLGAQSDYQGLVTNWYRGKMPSSAPLFDGSDSWSVNPECLTSSKNIDFTLLQLTNSYVSDGIWVSGPDVQDTLDLVLKFEGHRMVLTLRRALITVEIEPDLTAGHRGIIAGVLETEQVVAEFRNLLAAAWSGDFCGETYQPIADQIRACSDMLLDGTQDPAQTCNAISVGIGFEAIRAHVGPIGAEDPPQADPCP